MQKISYRELINREELQRLQDEFAAATGVLVYCLDDEGTELTGVSGPDNAAEIVQQYAAAGYIRNVLERVEAGSLEDLAIEEAENTGGKVAAIAIRMKGDTLLCWVAMQAEETEEGCFENILDLLRDASYTLMEQKVIRFNEQLENRRSLSEQEDRVKDLHVAETSAEIIQLLDSTEPIEKVMEHCLAAVGMQLEADSAQIFQLRTEAQEMDMLSEWVRPGLSSVFDRTGGLGIVSFLKTNKPSVVTCDAPAGEHHSDLVRLGLQAVMVFPILQQDAAGPMVLAVNCRNKKPGWGMQEVKFTSDAVKVLQSILTGRIQKNTIVSTHASLEAILDNVSCLVYVEERESGERLFANERLQRQFVMELEDGTFAKLVRNAWELRTGSRCEMYHRDAEHWYDLSRREIVWTDGRHALLYSLYDITDRKEYQKRLEQQEFTDFLTGLCNRMQFEKEFARLLDDAKQDGGEGMLLYVDLDDFGRVNDGLGHAYGDELLIQVARALRNIDEIGAYCYRMGGDEFAIVITPDNYAHREQILKDVRRIFGKSRYLKDAYYDCTASVGGVTFPLSGASVQELTQKAQLAVDEAKKCGKNRIFHYEDGVDAQAGRRLEMEKCMRAAVAEHFAEFEVYFQPIMDVRGVGTECVGAEALLRWNSGEFGMLLPEQFVPLAEQLGLINPIGNYVLHEACVNCRKWNEKGYPGYRVSVNLSPIQLLQPDIVEIVEETLDSTGLNPENLFVEVTEDLALRDRKRMEEVLERFRDLGVGIVLDDFGMGCSSLNHIRHLPLDTVKVGQDFVQNLAKDVYVQSFVEMLASLTECVGMSVCVEGIDTPEQYEELQGGKVRYMQGFYFDKPLRLQEFEEKYVESVEFL